MSQARPLGIWTAVLCGLGMAHAAAVLVFTSTSTLWFQAQLTDSVRLA